jgi:zinc finger protein
MDDLNVRVIRSSSATIEIPELGIMIEPATGAESFISNIEGLLNRVAENVNQAIKLTPEPKKKQKGRELLNRIEDVKRGKTELTIIISDPMGNSGIESDKTEERELTPEEIRNLETGITIIDVSKSKNESIR